MYLVGSAALEANKIKDSHKDYDYLCSLQEFDNFSEKNKGKIVLVKKSKFGKTVHLVGSVPLEFEIIDNNPSSIELVRNLEENKDYDSVGETKVVKPSIVLMMKMSHRFLRNSPHFKKTMNDIFLLRKLGFEMPSYSKQWLKIREKETYNYSHPSLNNTKDEFFADNFYVWDHDSIHEAIKLGEQPAYELIKQDKAEVNCSKQKFFEQPEEVRLATVYEESCVLALERHQIPNDFKPSPKKSFMIALEKVCTSISSGWWRNYAWENYYKVMALYQNLGESFYIENFKFAEKTGKLVPWKDSTLMSN